MNATRIHKTDGFVSEFEGLSSARRSAASLSLPAIEVA
jgi:hypothetical protein